MTLSCKAPAQNEFRSGKHQGKTIERVIIDDPEYVRWFMMEKVFSNEFRTLTKQCIVAFDKKPFIGKPCAKDGCTRTPVMFTLYKDSPDPMFWCDQCWKRDGLEPWTVGVRTYKQGVDHLKSKGVRSRREYRRMVVEVLAAKGLSGRVTKKKLEEFFGR